jgi:hypothetical protein
MNFVSPGPDTSVAEVTNVSAHGFWLLLGDEELFLPFTEFPWFANVRQANGPHGRPMLTASLTRRRAYGA